MLEHINTGIILFDKNKNCIYLNKYTKNTFGNIKTIDDFIELISDQDKNTEIENTNELFHNKKSLTSICKINTNDQSFLWFRINYTYISNDDKYLIHLENIDDLKKVEGLNNEKYYIFLANNSHELRTPINGIVGMLSLLEDTQLNTDQKDYVNMIKECSFNLMTIINDILDYSKLEIGKITLDNKPINISRCIESVNDIIISKVIEKSIDYSYNINSDVPIWINGDCNRLKQIILNLISNSIKFTESGSIFLNIEMVSRKDFILLKRLSKYETDENDLLDPNNTIYLRFDVTDTGCGIDISEKDKLFKSFSQVTKVTNKIYQGTGLGLAISKELVELMGGFIWLDWTEQDNGSRFSFLIKTQKCESLQEEKYDLSDTILHGLKVLILDDNVHNRISLTAMVNKWKMQAYSFSNAEEALYFTKITKFDIGLIDICMPKLDGPTFARKLKESDENKNMPLIALSSIGEKIQFIDKNFVCHLTKPVKEIRLKQKCQELANLIKKGPFENNINNSSDSNNQIDSVLENHLRSSIRILLAEDVYINQKVISSFLSKLGFNNVDIVENGAQCLEFLKIKNFDLLLLDIRMPLISGDIVLQEIVSYYKNPNNFSLGKFKNKTKPYSIAVTAYSLKEDKEKYLDMGFDDYIPKPINLNELSNCLNKFMNKLLEE